MSKSTRVFLASFIIAAICAVLGFHFLGNKPHASKIDVKLVSFSKSIEAKDNDAPFVHIKIKVGGFRIVIRDWFYHVGAIKKPYITIDQSGAGTLHIDTHDEAAIWGSKCEFLRQIEVEVPLDASSKLTTLRILNNDTGDELRAIIPFNDAARFDELISYSKTQATLENFTEGGC